MSESTRDLRPASGPPLRTPAIRAEGADDAVRPPIMRRRHGLMLGGLVVVSAVALGLADSAFTQSLLGQWATLAIAGIGFYLAFGLGGQFSFCQAAFVGVGAYTSAWATQTIGLSFVGGLLLAPLFAAVVGGALFLVIRRCDDFYFAIATLAFGFLAVVLLREWTAFAGPGGERRGLVRMSLLGETLSGWGVAAFSVAILIITVALALLIERSPLRREAVTVRTLPFIAGSLGLPVQRVRGSLFVVGAAYAGLAGSLLAHRSRVLSPEAFDIQLGIDLFLVLLFGGIGSVWGPVVGAAFVVWVPEQLRFVGRYRELVFGSVLVVVMIFVPDGLVGVAGRVWAVVRRVRPRRPEFEGSST